MSQKTTASQTNFDFTNMGSEMLQFRLRAIWNNGFWFGSPCTTNSCKLNLWENSYLIKILRLTKLSFRQSLNLLYVQVLIIISYTFRHTANRNCSWIVAALRYKEPYHILISYKRSQKMKTRAHSNVWFQHVIPMQKRSIAL